MFVFWNDGTNTNDRLSPRDGISKVHLYGNQDHLKLIVVVVSISQRSECGVDPETEHSTMRSLLSQHILLMLHELNIGTIS